MLLGWSADVWVAIGTLALALATFALAWQNRNVVQSAEQEAQAARDDLRVAREQADIAARSLAVQTQPFLSNVPLFLQQEPVSWYGGGEVASYRDAAEVMFRIDSRIDNAGKLLSDTKEATLSVPFRNIGAGAAVVRTVTFIFADGADIPGYAANPVVPSGEVAKARITVTQDAANWATIEETKDSDGNFSVVIGYADVAGADRGAVRLDVYSHLDNIHGPWYVRQVHYASDVENVLASPAVSSIAAE